jgi:endo-1,4-beta-xylanase
MRIASTALAACVLLAGCGATAPAPVPAPETSSPAPGTYAKPLGVAVTLEPLRSDRAYRKAFYGTFTSATPENELKWEVVQPRRGRFEFARGEAVVDAARKASMRVRGHPLVWDLQLPEWVKRAPKAQLEEILKTHVATVAERFRGRLAQWDVVNEPLEDSGRLTANVFHRALGEGYIDIAFREARRADPEAKLYLNEIAAERGVKARALVALVRRLRERGVPVDGVGLQNHTTARDFPSEQELGRLMRRFERLGVAVEITEMDVTGSDEVQRTKGFEAAARACMAAANCTGITVWGVTDARSWLGAGRKPTLFDAQGKPKPALGAVRRALAG